MIRLAACLLTFFGLALQLTAVAQEPSAGPAEQPQFVSFELLTNLRDPGRFLKIEISVEVTSPRAAQQLSAMLPKVKDGVIQLVSTLSYAEVLKPEEKNRLRQEVANIVSKQLETKDLKRVYFSLFIAQ